MEILFDWTLASIVALTGIWLFARAWYEASKKVEAIIFLGKVLDKSNAEKHSKFRTFLTLLVVTFFSIITLFSFVEAVIPLENLLLSHCKTNCMGKWNILLLTASWLWLAFAPYIYREAAFFRISLVKEAFEDEDNEGS